MNINNTIKSISLWFITGIISSILYYYLFKQDDLFKLGVIFVVIMLCISIVSLLFSYFIFSREKETIELQHQRDINVYKNHIEHLLKQSQEQLKDIEKPKYAEDPYKIGYIAVLTDDEENLQKKILMSLGVPSKNIFIDRLSLEKSSHRRTSNINPEFLNCLDRMKACDILYVKSCSSFSSSLQDFYDKLYKIVMEKEGIFHSVAENLFVTFQNRDAILGMLKSVLAIENPSHIERIKTGLKKCKLENRKYAGRPRQVNDEIIKEVQLRLKNGQKNRTIYNEMKLNPSTFYYIKNNYLHLSTEKRNMD